MRKSVYIFLFVALAFLGASSMVLASEPVNLGLAREAVAKYYDSGEYGNDIKNVVAKAECYIEKRMQQESAPARTNGEASRPKLAVTFDIDDTLLSTYATAKSYNFCETLPEIIANEKRGIYPAIPEMLNLYRFVQSKHIAIFLITGRHTSERRITENNLYKAGYADWQNLYMRPENFQGKVAVFKDNSRKLIEQQGYDIILNIGDQYSDLAGGDADVDFKLPNPMYFIP